MPRPSAGRDRILRHLLGSSALNVPLPKAYGRVQSAHELAKRTGVSRSWVYATIEDLSSHGWLRTVDSIEPLNPRAIFAWWKANRTELKVHSFHVADPKLALAELQRRGVETAITTYYAENIMQGHLFPRRGDCYVRAADLQKARTILVEEIDAQLGGTNLRLLVGDDGVLDEDVHIGEGNARVDYAPFPQVVLDLLTEGGSAAEAADMLIQKAYPYAKPSLH